MNLFNRLRGLFGGARGGSSGGRGFFGGLRERMEKRRREREYERSQRRQEKMDKERRREEEKQEKERDRKKKEEQHEKARETFKNRWGFNDHEYEDFIQFISAVPADLKEIFGSENLVEAFRTGKSYGLNNSDIIHVLNETYAGASGGATQEDIINDLYTNLQGYAQNVKYGGFV